MSVLAAQGEDLGRVALITGTFGLGAALPLLAQGLLSRKAILRWRGRMLSAGSGMKAALGVVLLAAGVLVLTGLDKMLEAAMIDGARNHTPTREAAPASPSLASAG